MDMIVHNPEEPQHIRHLRQLVGDTVAGGDPIALQHAMIYAYGTVRTAIGQARTNAGQMDPRRIQAFLEAYDEALCTLERMDDALARDDLGGLQDGFKALVVADQRVTALSQGEGSN